MAIETTLPQPRQSLMRFAQHCERKLRINDYKGGWRGEALRQLMRRLMQEHYELIEAWADLTHDPDDVGLRAAFRTECLDVANFCMMLYDNVPNGKKELNL